MSIFITDCGLHVLVPTGGCLEPIHPEEGTVLQQGKPRNILRDVTWAPVRGGIGRD